MPNETQLCIFLRFSSWPISRRICDVMPLRRCTPSSPSRQPNPENEEMLAVQGASTILSYRGNEIERQQSRLLILLNPLIPCWRSSHHHISYANSPAHKGEQKPPFSQGSKRHIFARRRCPVQCLIASPTKEKPRLATLESYSQTVLENTELGTSRVLMDTLYMANYYIH